MGCGHDACNNLLSLTMKWTGPMLYKQRLTADERIPKKKTPKNKEGGGVKIQGMSGIINPEGIRYSFDIWQ